MIYDIDNNPLPNYSITVDRGSSYVITIRCDCRTGQYLRSETVSDLTVEARLSGTSTWINIETTPIDLTTWNGSRQNFEIRLTADNVVVLHKFRIYTE